MILNNKTSKSALPLYEVHEVSMEEALLLLTSERQKQRESLINRVGNRLRMPRGNGRLQ